MIFISGASAQITFENEIPLTDNRFHEMAIQYETRLSQVTDYQEEESIRIRLADIYRYQEDYISALRQYRALLERPEFAKSAQKLLVLDRMASLLQETGNLEESVAIYEEILQYYDQTLGKRPKGSRADPAYVSTLLDLENVYVDLGDYQNAKAICFRLMEQPDEGIQSIVLDRLINLYDYEAITDDEMRSALNGARQGPNVARAYYRLADIYGRRGFTADAIECHKKLLELLPEQYGQDAEGLFKTYTDAGKLDDLAALLNQYSKDFPARTIYVRLLFETLCHQDKEEEALKELQTRARESQDPRLNEELARFLLSRQRYQDAEIIIQDLMNRYPDMPVYNDLLASAYKGQGRIDEALNVWKRQLDERPTETGYLSLARILRNEGKTDEAINLLRNAIGPNIDKSRFLHELILMLFEANRAPEAVDSLISLFELRPQESHIARDRARNAVSDLKCHEPAMAAVESTMQNTTIRSKPLVRSLLLGFYLDITNDSKRYDQAIPFLKKLAETATEGDLCLYNLGRRLIQTQDFKQAIASLSAVSQKSRFYADSIHQLGTAYLQSGEYDKAKEFLSRFVASATDPNGIRSPDPMINYSSLFQLAAVCVTLHQPGEALKWLNQIANLPTIPGFNQFGRGLIDLYYGHALSQLGSLDDALGRYQQAIAYGGPEGEEARFRTAEALLWKGSTEDAVKIYRDISSASADNPFADDALARRAALLDLSGETLELYSSADFFAWQGRTDEAINQYRELAIQMEGTDVAAWATYEIAKLKEEKKDFEGAAWEYEKVLEKTDHPVLRGLAQLAIADLSARKSDLLPEARKDAYQKVIIASPDSLYASIARMRLQETKDTLPY